MKLIDAEECARLIRNYGKGAIEDGRKQLDVVDDIIAIAAIPGTMVQAGMRVDAEPVVRCKDCKYYREGKIITGVKFCFRLKNGDKPVGYNFSDDDFCSRGERR